MDRFLANLPQNPHAVFPIREPGTSLAEWKGIRVYLKMKAAATSGRQLDGYRTRIGKVIGADTSKKMIHAMVTFEVTELRPLVDMGRGREKSI
jgi:hypothetical protein